MTPIQTRYAGCHFRSRLEARWAVFFDAMGIPWEYEPQGFELGWRLKLDWDDPFRYLPDFWLPSLGIWAEVKGDPSDAELDQLLNAAAALSSPSGGCGQGGDMLICGPFQQISNLYHGWVPTRLHMHKGDLEANPGISTAHHRESITIARDVGPSCYSEVGFTLNGIRPVLFENTGLLTQLYIDAVTAARSARFEHGQSGAT